MSITYSSYLKVNQLLSLQEPKSEPAEHDELLFIVIHQVYELWFKQLIHEFEKINADLSAGELFGAIATFKRVRTIMKTLVGQLDILETMTPMSFTSFRDRLEQASGFQSVQFRELEFMLGFKRPRMLEYHERNSAAYLALQERLRQPSVVDHFYDFLEHHEVTVPSELRQRDATMPAIGDERIQAGVLRLYRQRPDVAILFEQMIDYDEGQQEWRYRHTKMVERTIGNKQGTGGSLGVEFLKRSLFQPLFTDLWAVRHEL